MFRILALFALVALCASQKSALEHDVGSVIISEPAPVEYAQSGGIVKDVIEEKIGGLTEAEHISVPAPAIDLAANEIHLAKETPEIVDIPHVPLNLPGNKIENTDLHIDVPSPIIEAPKPIFVHKPTIFRVPQPIIQIPKPIIEHTPVYYRVPHGVQYPRHEIHTQPYIANPLPYAVTGHNSYVAPKVGINVAPKVGVNVGKPTGSVDYLAPHGKGATSSFSFSLNFPPSSGKTIVKHFRIGHY